MKEFRLTDPDCPFVIVVRVQPLAETCTKCGVGMALIHIDTCFEGQMVSGHAVLWCEGCHPGAA